jgi:uncharacterized protein
MVIVHITPGRLGMARSDAHNAVELEELPRLRDILDAGHDVEEDAGDGWTLLRHAIDTEIDGHVQTGEPLHVDTTALLLARGADPLRLNPAGVSALGEAEARGHWLAVELMRAWVRNGEGSDARWSG